MTTRITSLILTLGLLTVPLVARDLRAEIKRAAEFGQQTKALITGNDLRAYWAADDSRLIYQINSGPDATSFVSVDPATGEKSPAFDPEPFAAALSKAAGKEVDPRNPPIGQLEITADGIRFRAFGRSWIYSTSTREISPEDRPPTSIKLMPPEATMRGSRRNGPATSLTIENATDGEIEMFWVQRGGELKSGGKLSAGQSMAHQTFAGHVWLIKDARGNPLAGLTTPEQPSLARITGRVESDPGPDPAVSPDGKWRALILNHNLVIEPTGSGSSVTLTEDGSEKDTYTRPFIWSPDSTKLVAFRVKDVETRRINIVQSSPPDQVQPKLKTIDYPKPGDPIPQPMPHLFDVEHTREIPIDHSLFENPWSINNLAWTGGFLGILVRLQPARAPGAQTCRHPWRLGISPDHRRGQERDLHRLFAKILSPPSSSDARDPLGLGAGRTESSLSDRRGQRGDQETRSRRKSGSSARSSPSTTTSASCFSRSLAFPGRIPITNTSSG